MHAIINRLTLTKPFDAELLRKMEDFLIRVRRDNPGLIDAKVVKVSETVAIVLALYATREVLDEVSSKLAGPWFAEHVRPYLAGPVDRQVGEVIAQMPASS
jgi:hypothetical protein